MEPPLKSQGCGLVQRRRATRPGRPIFAPNRPAPLIVDRQSCRSADNLRAVRQIPLRAQRKSGTGYAMFPRSLSPGPVWADASPAPERCARLRRLSLDLAFVVPARPRRGRRFLPRQGLGVFRHAWVSEKRSQTLNSGEKHYG